MNFKNRKELPTKKDSWDKVQIIATSLIAPLLAGAVTFVGYAYNQSAKDSEVKLKYIELAVNILKNTPTQDNEKIRVWAVRILEKYSEIDNKDKLIESLAKQQLVLSAFKQPKFEVLLKDPQLKNEKQNVLITAKNTNDTQIQIDKIEILGPSNSKPLCKKEITKNSDISANSESVITYIPIQEILDCIKPTDEESLDFQIAAVDTNPNYTPVGNNYYKHSVPFAINIQFHTSEQQTSTLMGAFVHFYKQVN